MLQHLLEPVGESHHDVECGQGEHEVKEGPRVSHLVLLVVVNVLTAALGVPAGRAASVPGVLDKQLIASGQLGSLKLVTKLKI